MPLGHVNFASFDGLDKVNNFWIAKLGHDAHYGPKWQDLMKAGPFWHDRPGFKFT